MNRPDNPFDNKAAEYDAWFDSGRGDNIFQIELNALQDADVYIGKWVEVGAGTGRFTAALNIESGVEPSESMAAIAKKRGIRIYPGTAESLPFISSSFDGVLIVCAISFVDDALQTLQECQRVLRINGTLVVGFIPADSLWGRYYAYRGKNGHEYYEQAMFYTEAEIIEMAESAGLKFAGRTARILPELENFAEYEQVLNNFHRESFVVLKFLKG